MNRSILWMLWLPILALATSACNLPFSAQTSPTATSTARALPSPTIRQTARATETPELRPYSATATAIAATEISVIDSSQAGPAGAATPTMASAATSPAASSAGGTGTPRDSDPGPTPTSQAVTLAPSPSTGNLLANPYFEGCHNCTDIAQWVSDGTWDVSIKGHNPSPNHTAARCTKPEVHGSCETGGPAYLYQIVNSDPSHTTLGFSIAYILSRADGSVTIYGGPSASGPWEVVWLAWQSNSSGHMTDWSASGYRETQIAAGHPYYKFEIFGQFDPKFTQGLKFTAAYFSTSP